MSSSGLIYAVIVGAWAVYLVPMWLRRQDELNERRDRERFTTAIRLLGRKPSMERWYASEVRSRSTAGAASRNAPASPAPVSHDGPAPHDGRAPRTPTASHSAPTPGSAPHHGSAPSHNHAAAARHAPESFSGTSAASHGSARTPHRVSAPLFPGDASTAEPPQDRAASRRGSSDRSTDPAAARRNSPGSPAGIPAPQSAATSPASTPSSGRPTTATGLLDTRWSTRVTSGWETMRRHSRRAAAAAEELERRRTVLARRRRVVSALFLVFSLGVLATALGGFGWVPLAVIPALLLSVYIPYLRAQERRRYAARMRRRESLARAAARRSTADQPSSTSGVGGTPGGAGAASATGVRDGGGAGAAGTHGAHSSAAPGASPATDTRQAQWLADLDASHRHANAAPATRGDTWDPVSIPRPTYADAPVADHPTPPHPHSTAATPVTPPTPLDHYRRAAGE